MSEGWAAWELPASEHLRTVAEVLRAGPTPEERARLKLEDDEKKAERSRVQDAVFADDTVAFRARINGTPAHTPLASAAAEPFRDREAAARRRAAIEILKAHDLADVITGGASGCVLDPNVGILEPVRDEAQRAELDRAYESGRAEREAEWGRREVNRYRAQLAERWAAR